MATNGFEIPTEFRDFADKSVDQARTAFGSFISGAVRTSEQLQSTGSDVQSAVHAALLKSIDHAQANASATFDFTQKLARAADMREAFEIQSEFVKGRFTAWQAQVKDFGSLARKTAH